MNASAFMRKDDAVATGAFTPAIGSSNAGEFGLTLVRRSIGTQTQSAPEKLKLVVTYGDPYLCNQITTIQGVSSISDGLYITQGG